ncbi:MAG: DUF533 domain-containing protein [Hyphomicrobium sp.]|nr:DUF533 domain-containing protein [Hyphomicrobium sp.]PPD06380.1 MAG: protein YebE [Hyphomicrobium sp.]
MFDAKALLDQITRSVGPQGGAAPDGPGGGGLGGGLADMLTRVTQGGGQGGAGGLVDTLTGVLGQATQGVRDASNDSGLTNAARGAVTRVSGQAPEDIVSRVTSMVSNNQLATGAVLGGLGGLLLGTKTGREFAGDAVQLGAAALIGGLAYKAYQNYKSGQPMIATGGPVAAAPAGTGFEPQAMSNDTAVRILRAMIAASAADGRIDERESEKILSTFRQSGADREAEAFLTREIQSPATAAILADGVRSETEAIEVYTAARIAIDPDTPAEQNFLADLAGRLRIAPALAAQIDTAARRAV